MSLLELHDLHASDSARFGEVNGQELVGDFGDVAGEHAAIRERAGLIDLSFRSRLCLVGSDRQRFLNGQVTNDVNALAPGQGCYAALITAKGKMVSDLNICLLENEILLDFEPGFSRSVAERLQKYVIADDVEVIDVASLYGLLSIQGPLCVDALEPLRIEIALPSRARTWAKWIDVTFGEIYVVNLPRTGTAGFDFFVPVAGLAAFWSKLKSAAALRGARPAGWDALEIARIEAGIPRYGADMDESNLPPEAGLENSAISYAKGCYIGQEVIARIRTYGQVAKALRGLRFDDNLPMLPKKGDKLLKGEKEVGYITTAVASPALGVPIALGYVRRETNHIGAELIVRTDQGDGAARIVELPFR